MHGQLFRRAPLGRDYKNVEVAVSIAGESDPLSIGRKACIDITSTVHRQPLHVLAVFIRGPNVAEIAENNAAIMIMRITDQSRFATKRERRARENQHYSRQEDILHVCEPRVSENGIACLESCLECGRRIIASRKLYGMIKTGRKANCLVCEVAVSLKLSISRRPQTNSLPYISFEGSFS